MVAELATEHLPAELVLGSPFIDLASVGQIHYPFLPVRALLKDRFPIAEYVARIAAPITVVYGTEDSIVPPEEGRRSVAGARWRTRLVAVEGRPQRPGTANRASGSGGTSGREVGRCGNTPAGVRGSRRWLILSTRA